VFKNLFSFFLLPLWYGSLARVIAFCALFGAIFGLMALLRFTIGDSIALNITAMVVFMGVCFAIVGGVGCAVAACCRRRAISRRKTRFNKRKKEKKRKKGQRWA
jgi:hypothetical protein